MGDKAKINVELLEKIKKHILAEPRRLNMEHFARKVPTYLDKYPPCGTVACIAGWAVLLSRPEEDWNKFPLGGGSFDWEAEACRVMGIAERYDNPFYNFDWGVPEVVDWIDGQIVKARA